MTRSITNARVSKELRALRLPWILAVLAAGYVPFNGFFFYGHGGEPFFLGVTYFVLATSVTIACATVFGSEFQHRTLEVLLTQPLPRLRIFSEKMAALGIVAASLAVMVALAFLLACLYSNSIPEPGQFFWDAILLLVLLCSCPFWTLVARSTLGGAVLSVFAMCLSCILLKGAFNTLALHLSKAAASGDLEPHQMPDLWPLFHSLLIGGSLLYSALFLWLGWRKFSRFEIRAGGSSRPVRKRATQTITAERATATPAFLRMDPSCPIANFVRKEIWLQLPLVKLAVLFCLCWFAAAAVSSLQVVSNDKFQTFLNLLTLFYIPVTLILAGCLSLGEEKSWNLHAGQLALPFSVNLQWLLKLAVSVAVGVVFAILVPFLLSNIAAGHLKAGLEFLTTRDAWLGAGLGAAATLIAAFWSATLFQGTMRAALATLAVLAGSLLIFGLTLYLVQQLQIGLAVIPLDWLTVRNHLSPTHFSGWVTDKGLYLSILLVLLLFGLERSRIQFRRAEPSRRYIWFSSVLLGLVVFCVSFIAIDSVRATTWQSRRSASMLAELQNALAAIGRGQANSTWTNRTISHEELKRTGLIDPRTLRWLEGVQIQISSGVAYERGHKIRRWQADFFFPNGERFSLPVPLNESTGSRR